MPRILLSIVFLSLLIILFGINRGFDFSDEGLYAFLADPEQANDGGIFNYDLFFKLLHRVISLEFGIVELRFFRLVSYLAGAWALAVFWKNTNSQKSISFEVYLIAVLGLFSGYAFLPPSLSYNSISVVLAFFWLANISKQEKNQSDFFILGLILGLLFYVKITSCLVLGFLTLGISVYKGEFNWKLITGLTIPFLVMEFCFYLSLGQTGVIRLAAGLDLMTARNDYGYFLLVKYLAVGIFWLFIAFVPFWIAGFFHLKSKGLTGFFGFLGLISLISIFTYTMITDEWHHAVLLISSGVLGFVLGKYGIRNLNPTQLLGFFLLVGMPFFLFFGSNVYWLRLGIHYWVFWIFALMMFFPGFSRRVQDAFKLGIAIASLLLVFNGIWLSPFGQESLWKSNLKWEYGSGKSILLSQSQVTLLKNLKEKADLFSNEELLAIYRIPGILYLLNLNSPKSPGYWSRSHLDSYFPEGVDFDMIIYSPSDSLPVGEWDTFKKKQYRMPDGEEIQVLWR